MGTETTKPATASGRRVPEPAGGCRWVGCKWRRKAGAARMGRTCAAPGREGARLCAPDGRAAVFSAQTPCLFSVSCSLRSLFPAGVRAPGGGWGRGGSLVAAWAGRDSRQGSGEGLAGRGYFRKSPGQAGCRPHPLRAPPAPPLPVCLICVKEFDGFFIVIIMILFI